MLDLLMFDERFEPSDRQLFQRARGIPAQLILCGFWLCDINGHESHVSNGWTLWTWMLDL
jgi:hypothetical protein